MEIQENEWCSFALCNEGHRGGVFSLGRFYLVRASLIRSHEQSLAEHMEACGIWSEFMSSW